MSLVFGALALAVATISAQSGATPADDPWRIDFRYAPPVWQTSICLPDDWQKTIVGKDGSLLYDYPGRFAGFGTRITFGLRGEVTWVRQTLAAPRVPIVQTVARVGSVELQTEAFAVAPAHPVARNRVNLEGDRERGQVRPTNGGMTFLELSHHPARHDVLIVRLWNRGQASVEVTPTLTIESQSALTVDPGQKRLRIGTGTELQCVEAYANVESATNRVRAVFTATTLKPGGQRVLAFCIARGAPGPVLLRSVAQAQGLRRQAERFWRKLDLPYDRLEVPDAGVQALLDSAIRNIYQAREIKQGLPAFQVGPTCYRGLWVVDGSFIMEAMAYLGRLTEAREGIQYLTSFQRDDGGFLLIDGHWKETGIVLWAITRHARLTGDRPWLRAIWPRVERAVAFVQQMRVTASANAAAPNCGLIPDGFSDGGLADRVPEYTNIYWTLAGLRAAIQAARWFGQEGDATAWQREFDDFYATFRRAAARDTRTDGLGHRYLPIRMRDNGEIPPQKAQWGFLHAVFPGKVFAADDALVAGNMAMLHSVEREGLVLDTGWLKDGIWNYFGSFYAHAWLWLGNGDKAARTLYAFGNHASPLLVWREEQKPRGEGAQFVGDMPHNWASAEFIRLVRHLLVLERGNELHLFEGLPPTWARPGAVTRINHVMSEFGPLSLEFRVARDGRTGWLRLEPPTRTPPGRIVLHLDHWSGRSGVLELPTHGVVRKRLAIDPRTPQSPDDRNFLADVRSAP
ncbi:MAG: hypothetical protein KGS61_06005 [Verrucomicrobia bacterium]|nr:hypothetical protein [Verrucomicrobiota bacterium]